MSPIKLTLFSRSGCCLCEGLEESLKNLSLNHLDPPLKLLVRDIDGVDVQNYERELYSLKVPVLLIELDSPYRRVEFPRASPRLSEEDLFNWLQKNLSKILKKD